MLESIKKKFFNAVEKEPEMVKENPQAAELVAEQSTELAAAQAAMASQASLFAAAQTQLAEMTAKFESAQAALAEIEAAKEALVQDAKATKLATRKQTIVAAIGESKSEALLSATEALDDAAFASVVGALAGSVEEEAKSQMFQEVGVDAQADKTQVAQEESTEAKLLKAKYTQSK